MGMAPSIISFMAREAKRNAIDGEVLTLGRQNVFADYEQVQDLIKAEGLTPKQPKETQRGVDGTTVFEMLGADTVISLDVSDYEDADVIVDLNLPVSDQLKSRFSLIFDGGTLEHVFDTRQALRNVVEMLKPGGRVIHQAPASNFIDHGYFSISPVLFMDYYHVQAFDDCRLYLMPAQDSSIALADVVWSYTVYDPIPEYDQSQLSGERVMLSFCGRKTKEEWSPEIPIQGQARRALNADIKKAERLELGGDLDGAVPLIEDAVRHWPESVVLNALYGRMQLKKGNLAVAEKAFGMVRSLDPHCSVISDLINLSDLPLSRESLAAALSMNQESQKLRKMLAMTTRFDLDREDRAARPKMIIFGSGQAGRQALGTMASWADVLAFADNDPKKHGAVIARRTILSADQVVYRDYDYVVIASMYAPQIKAQLSNLGVSPSVVLEYTYRHINLDV